jgi:hypothetical protein
VAVPFKPDDAVQDSFGPELALETDPDAQGWTLTASTKLTRLGDLDSDGFDDVAYTFSVDWRGVKHIDDTIVESSARADGVTCIFYGAANRLSVENPRASAAAVLPGVTAIDRIGDVNGDGYPDLIAKKNHQVYVMPGGVERLTGSIAPEQVGAALLPPDSKQDNGLVLALWDVVGIGDLDADGFDDLMVHRTGPYYDYGATFLFYGGAHRFEQLLLEEGADAEFEQDGAGRGLYQQPLGDWNGDGHEDLLLGSNDLDNARSTAVVIPGGTERYSGVVSTDMLDEAADGRRLDGMLFTQPLGDIDGDGRVDLEVDVDGRFFVKYGGPFESVIY